MGLSCHVSGSVEGGVIPGSWILPSSIKWAFSPHSSLKNKRPGPRLTAQGWETCLIICAQRLCPQPGSNGRLLGSTALPLNHASGKRGVCSGRFAMTKPLWKRLSVNEKKESSLLFMSATEGPKQGVIKKKVLFPKDWSGRKENSSFKISSWLRPGSGALNSDNDVTCKTRETLREVPQGLGN